MELHVPTPTRFNRAMKRIAASRLGIWVLSHSLNYFDRLVAKLAHTSSATVLAGLPVLQVTTRPSAAGTPHTVPLVSVPMGDEVILIASNWGKASHPVWYTNLRAYPTVEVSYRGEIGEYTARELDGPQRTECWRRAVDVYPGFDAYQRRAGERRIPVVLLAPKQAAEA